MTKDEAKERIEKILAYMESLDADEEEVKDIDALNTAIKALEDSRWIPITERLPDKEGDYFTTKINDFDEPILGMAYYRKEWGWSTSYKITAWMPLPEHYEEGAEG